MVRFGLELVEYVFNNTVFVDQEADAVQAIVNLTHEFLLAPNTKLLSNGVVFIRK